MANKDYFSLLDPRSEIGKRVLHDLKNSDPVALAVAQGPVVVMWWKSAPGFAPWLEFRIEALSATKAMIHKIVDFMVKNYIGDSWKIVGYRIMSWWKEQKTRAILPDLTIVMEDGSEKVKTAKQRGIARRHRARLRRQSKYERTE